MSNVAVSYLKRMGEKDVYPKTVDYAKEEVFDHFENSGEDILEDPSYKSKGTILSPAEQKFFNSLDALVSKNRYHISIKPRLADLIDPANVKDKSKEWWQKFARIQSKHVDFAITKKPNMSIIGVIELDDISHLRKDRQERDRFVDQALRDAGIPILHFPCFNRYDTMNLKNALHDTFSLTDDE